MDEVDRPPIICFVGKKNSGKTTLLVAVAAELKRRGLRIATAKHGHHELEIDQPGRDSWRHFHEGGAEAVLILSSRKLALVMDTLGEEPDVLEAIDRHFGGRAYDAVLVEGYKHGNLPKIEIYRSRVHSRPVHDPMNPDAAATFLALVTDDPSVAASCPVIPLDGSGPDGGHVQAVADLVEQRIRRNRVNG
ncbi:MAG TPA: molybdopterin-guanine dinucleotide biosynthesis protein B [Longimicrobiaceae bacterium]